MNAIQMDVSCAVVGIGENKVDDYFYFNKMKNGFGFHVQWGGENVGIEYGSDVLSRRIGRIREEDCILVDRGGHGYLAYPDGKEEYLGYKRQIRIANKPDWNDAMARQFCKKHDIVGFTSIPCPDYRKGSLVFWYVKEGDK